MKKTHILLTTLLTTLFTATGCGETTPSFNPTQVANEAKIITAIDSLRGKTHQINISQAVTIVRPNDELSVDFTNIYEFTHTHYYGDNVRAFSTGSYSIYYDHIKGTGEMDESTYRTHKVDEQIYFKLSNGYAQVQNLTFQNELETAISAYYDEETGRYTPIMFDTEFKNPFDYVSYRDVVVNNDGSLSLINQKIDFVLECYNTVGMNTIKENKLVLNSKGEVTAIEFVIPDQIGAENSYIRSNTITLTYEREGIKTAELKPFENENPELEAAFAAIKNTKNYSYTKTYVQQKQVDGTIKDHNVKGYFTEDVVYFHHHDKPGDTTPYEGDDDYDYKAVKESDGKYYVYQYSMATDTFGWGIVMASATTPLFYDYFEELGPIFSYVDPAIFKKTGEYTYEIETYFLSTSGIIFDFGMMGVASDAFDGGTTKCVVTLNEDGSLGKVETTLKFLTETLNITYTLSDIGTTVVPTWAL